MKLEQSFEVGAPIEDVWQTLIDVERVAPCLPGADITQANEDGSYEGTFQVKLGPTTAAYTGKLSMESLDEEARTATMKASGRDKRGQGSANATIVNTLHEEGQKTRVEVETDFTITGRLARFGRGGMIQDISNRLLRDFAQCLQQNLEAEGAAAPEQESGPPATAGEGGATGADETPSPTAGRPPTASPGPAPAATGEAGGKPPRPAAEPRETPAEGADGGAGPKPAAPARPRPAAQPAKPVRGFSLFFSVLFERIKRFFARLRSR
jgi:uncharacterized protein